MPTDKKPKFKIVFRKGNTLTKVAVLVVAVLSTVALIAIHGAIDRAQDKAEALKQEALNEALEKEELEQDISALGSADSVEEIAGERDDIVVGKVNVDEEMELAVKFGIVSIPTLVYLKDGMEVDKIVGYRPKADIEDMLV